MARRRGLVIGTRGSKLALAQAGQVAEALRKAHPDLEFRIEIIATRGDQDQSTALGRETGVGFFTRELELALLQERIDLAVHSLKDLPTAQPEGLTVGRSVPPREEVRDVLISRSHKTLDELPPETVVGTGSLRRQAQLAHLRSDLKFQPIRGNVDTRLRKVREGEVEATVLAWAGLRRSGLYEDWMEVLSLQRVLPAPGQGALGLETRSDDEGAAQVVAALDDPATRWAVTAERAVMSRLGGGCHVPVAALGQLDQVSGALMVEAVVAAVDGRHMVRRSLVGRPEAAAELGAELAEHLLAAGAAQILENL